MIRCNNCMQVYHNGDALTLMTDEHEKYRGCESCKTDKYLMYLEEANMEQITIAAAVDMTFMPIADAPVGKYYATDGRDFVAVDTTGIEMRYDRFRTLKACLRFLESGK